MRNTREAVIFAVSVAAVFLLTTYALAGPGGGGTGPGGGCPVATATSPGCVTTTTIANQPGYTATGAAPQWTCSSLTATCEVLSSINPATASTTVAAVTVAAPPGLDADDLAFQVLVGAGYVCKVDVEGDTQIAGDFAFSDALTTTTATSTALWSSATNAATASATVGAFTLEPSTALGANDLVLNIFDVTGGTSIFKVDEDGDVAIAGSGIVGGSSIDARFRIDTTNDTTPVTITNWDSRHFVAGKTGAGLGGFGVSYNQTSGIVYLLAVEPAVAWRTFEYRATGHRWYAASGNTLGLELNASLTLTLAGAMDLPTTGAGTCTLDGATPSVCTATVTAAAICTCSPVGATAAIAAGGCAVGLSGTTLTITGPAAATHNVNYHCFL